jgi:predicted short-subunit dehydrogenase-like oxidoreductase (DUF2520 family)
VPEQVISGESYGGEPSPSTGRVAVLGLGRAGSALAGEFLSAGVDVTLLWNRGERALPEPIGSRAVFGPLPSERLAEADVILLAVLDGAIAEFASTVPAREGAVVLHLSGASESRSLDPGRRGVRFGGYHPLQAFRPAGPSPFPIPPYCLALDGHPDAVLAGRALAGATGHPSVELPPGGKAAYHCAAVLASNCLVALEATAERVMRSAGVAEGEAWSLLWPLVVGTLANLPDGRFATSITGPVRRGDAGTVARNLGALLDDAGANAVYKVLGQEALSLAKDAGLGEERAEAVARALAETVRDSTP